MNYKQKYKNALERAREQYNKRTPLYDIESIFPELKENKDERIRKEIIDFIKSRGGFKGDWLAWLEKQKKQKHFSVFNADDWYVSKVDGKIHNAKFIKFIEKQDEEKSIDEVEPKFKIGNWITDGHLTCKVLSVTGKFYELHLYNDDYCHFETDVQSVDKRYHLWTIADAKDGDVLASEDKDKIFLYNGKLDLRGRACAYCGIYKTYDGLRFVKCTVGNYFTYKEPYPTTKEQRDTLFAKMADAGYEWDANKKELKRVEPKILDINTVIG